MLVSFIPMLMDTGGNCGSQSSTLIIRGIALDEIHFKDIFRVVFKEFRVALLVSAVLSLVNGVRVYLMYQNPLLALVVGISLIGTVILSKLIGCTLPLFAERLRLDPALMAAPLISTIIDTCSILIYFGVATRVFHL
jgi:magnesium transporter